MLKHCLYIQYGCGMQSVVFYIWASPYPTFPKFGPHLHRYNSVRLHPYPSTAYECAQSLCIHPIWMWDAPSVVVYSLNHDTTAHLGSALPKFSKICPHVHRYNSVRVHPYTHPQHMNVLNHFLYIQYGFGMQSVVVYSLNHDTKANLASALPQFFTIWPQPAQV